MVRLGLALAFAVRSQCSVRLTEQTAGAEMTSAQVWHEFGLCPDKLTALWARAGYGDGQSRRYFVRAEVEVQ